MKETVKKLLRNHCPNIPALRRKLGDHKLSQINRYIMPYAQVKAGEASFDAQRELVAKYSEKWPSQTRRLNEKMEDYIGRCERLKARPDLDELRTKVLFACFAHGFQPDEFFVYELEHKGLDERRSYISDRELLNLAYEINDIIDLGTFLDKFKTYRKFKRFYRRQALPVEGRGDRAAFMTFAKAHETFVIKNVMLSKGDSVQKIVTAETDLDKLFERMLTDGKYIVEECVTQSGAMARLSLVSVNTIRIITFNTPRGVVIGPCFLKVGRGRSFVDNGGKGGILIGIDSDTGRLNTLGYDEFLTEFAEHPDTGVTFIGYQLPEWEKAKAMALEASAMTPSVGYIGWDFAHTDDGWIVIEGNGCSQVIGPQIVWRRGFKKDVEQILGRPLRDYSGE